MTIHVWRRLAIGFAVGATVGWLAGLLRAPAVQQPVPAAPRPEPPAPAPSRVRDGGG